MFSKDTINEVAGIVLKILKYDIPAYDPEKAVSELGGIIKNDIIDDCEDARIERTGDNSNYQFEIHLNKNKPFYRTRFSIAMN